MPQELYENWICDRLGITYTELLKQPADWIEKQLLFLAGKEKAMVEKERKRAKK